MSVTCDEACTATASASVNVPGASKVFKLKQVKSSLAAGAKTKLKIKLLEEDGQGRKARIEEAQAREGDRQRWRDRRGGQLQQGSEQDPAGQVAQRRDDDFSNGAPDFSRGPAPAPAATRATLARVAPGRHHVSQQPDSPVPG